MSTPLVFIDTETDGLHPGRKAWEIALIRRDHLGQTETHFFVGIDIRDSNPDALSIGRFWDRHPSGRKMAGLKALPDSVNLLTQHDAAKEVMRWTFGAHLVGAIPSFDAEVFARMLRSNGYLPSWHHRLYCIESIVMGHFGRPVGGLRACAEAVGVMVPDGAEHTAMGDARTVAAIWDVVMAGGVRMSTMLPESAIRVLVTPCGCWVGADATDEIPGFCRSEDEAREDLRLGLTEVRAPVEDARKRLGECPHGIYMAGGAS